MHRQLGDGPVALDCRQRVLRCGVIRGEIRLH
jgi:hypothetical protein